MMTPRRDALAALAIVLMLVILANAASITAWLEGWL